MVRRTRLPKRRFAVVDERVERVIGLSEVEDSSSCRALFTYPEAKEMVAHLKKGGKNVRVVKVEP
jgi:phosphoserine phosphatase